MSIIGFLLYWVVQIYFYALMARFISDLVMSFNATWRPKGLLLPILDLVYTVTDPPLKFVRRFVPPLRLGPVALDLAWTIVVIAVLFLRGLVQNL
jgi:YggT family protein